MSGGSYNYIYSTLQSECSGQMYDDEMNEMIDDLCDVLHDLEWWISGDSDEDRYRKTVQKFRAKWFQGNREKRLKGYIDRHMALMRNELYRLIGEVGDESS